jgi:hypothetical protein
VATHKTYILHMNASVWVTSHELLSSMVFFLFC